MIIPFPSSTTNLDPEPTKSVRQKKFVASVDTIHGPAEPTNLPPWHVVRLPSRDREDLLQWFDECLRNKGYVDEGEFRRKRMIGDKVIYELRAAGLPIKPTAQPYHVRTSAEKLLHLKRQEASLHNLSLQCQLWQTECQAEIRRMMNLEP